MHGRRLPCVARRAFAAADVGRGTGEFCVVRAAILVLIDRQFGKIAMPRSTEYGILSEEGKCSHRWIYGKAIGTDTDGLILLSADGKVC